MGIALVSPSYETSTLRYRLSFEALVAERVSENRLIEAQLLAVVTFTRPKHSFGMIFLVVYLLLTQTGGYFVLQLLLLIFRWGNLCSIARSIRNVSLLHELGFQGYCDALVMVLAFRNLPAPTFRFLFDSSFPETSIIFSETRSIMSLGRLVVKPGAGARVLTH